MSKDDNHSEITDKGEAWRIVNSADTRPKTPDSNNESNPLEKQPTYPDESEQSKPDESAEDSDPQEYVCTECGADLFDYRKRDTRHDFQCVDCGAKFKED